MNIVAMIPARFESQRFPGKPLALIGGRPMIQWVYEATQSCSAFSQVLVATDSPRIGEAVRSFGGKVEMTRTDHLTGTDRIAELAERYTDADVVANVQGDQPFVTTEILTTLVAPYLAGECPDMTTIASPLQGSASETDPTTVKVVCDNRMRALYFSRAPIPYYRERRQAPVYHHLGLYAFRRDFLKVYASLPATPLELCEQLEQLRALENGYTIQVGLTDRPVIEVNTPADLVAANAMARTATGSWSSERGKSFP